MTNDEPTDSPSRLVYAQLTHDIVTGALSAGTALVEVSLAAKLGVSRTPVREALTRLEQDGLVERYNRGIRVRSRTPEQILEIYDIRIVLESMAASAAARNRTPLALARIEQAHHRLLNANTDDRQTRIELNRDFHRALWAASQNLALVDLLRRLNMQSQQYSAGTLFEPGRWEAAMSEHQALLDAVRDQDAELAGQIASAHLSAARELRLKAFSAN